MVRLLNKFFLVLPVNIEDANKWAMMRKSLPPKEEDIFIQKCQWIKSLTIRQGYLQITRHSLKYLLRD